MEKYSLPLSAKIFISGASSGLGFHLARECISLGYTVWGIGRRKFDLDNIEPSLQKNFKYSLCDTTVKEQVKNTIEEMVRSNFIPDIAIFCAGSAVEDIREGNFELEKFKENFNVNLHGVLYWVELMLPFFLERNKGIFAGISSMSIYRENHNNRIGYSASKIALNKSFENLRLEYLNTGVKFVIFNMGRMKERNDLIGTSYAKAAALIVKILKSGKCSNTVNIPRTQYFLTKLAQFIPEEIFKKCFVK